VSRTPIWTLPFFFDLGTFSSMKFLYSSVSSPSPMLYAEDLAVSAFGKG